MSVIEFHTSPALMDRIPRPYPASRDLPDWFRDMSADFGQGGTLKRCPPFLAAMTAGYLIPAPSDARLVMGADGEITVRAPVDASGQYVSFLSGHFPGQFAGSPFAAARVVKFENPWVIVTPPDHLCLITAPINRFSMPFTALTGIVETATYYREVHLPMVCTMRPGDSFDVLRGMPMIQVIPMRREEWESDVATLDAPKRNEQESMFTASAHFYKERFWQKQQFS